MPLFAHQPYYTVPNNDFSNFGSLVRFIDDWDKHFSQQKSARQGGQKQQQPQACQPRRNFRSFTPRFDVRETEQGYELHGELPGVEKKDINIEFSDLQTIVISGSVERNYTAGTPPASLLIDNGSNNDVTAMSGAVTTTDAESHVGSDDASETRSTKSFQATVEDSTEEDGEGDWVKPSTTTAEPQAADDNTSVAPTINTPATTAAAVAETPATEAQQPRHKYWVQERSVGRFSRSFSFASRVDHDGVTASLDNGILTVVVPRAKKPEPRRIAIF